jgi:2,5-diketo-D-gluconate reductase A
MSATTTTQGQPRIAFHDGNAIPQVGLGVFAMPEHETAGLVHSAIAAGYRHIDTAAMYNNEVGVGEGVRRSGTPREEIFVTTKLWSTDHGRDAALAAFERSERALGLGPVDLYLIHWPSPQRGLYVETWRTLIELQGEGRIRSIGVSNFAEEHLERLIEETGVTPVVNQIECHPAFQQRALRTANARLGIVSESWGPLGRGHLLRDPVLARIGEKHGRTPAQVMIRWHVQSGLVVIPKSSKPERIAANFDVFTFALDEADMAAIAAMDDPAGRIGPDPYATSW